MANQRIDQIAIGLNQIEETSPLRKRIQWTIWDLITLTGIVAVTLGLPIPAYVLLLAFSACLAIVLLPLLGIYFITLKNRKRLNSDEVFVSLISKALIFAMVVVVLCGVAMWTKVIASTDPTQTWEQVTQALQRL